MEKDEIRRIIAQVLETHPLRMNVQKVSLFGSRVDGTERPDSDVDLIVDFTGSVSLFDMGGLQQDLEQAMGLHVDLQTPGSISVYFLDDALRRSEALYSADEI